MTTKTTTTTTPATSAPAKGKGKPATAAAAAATQKGAPTQNQVPDAGAPAPTPESQGQPEGMSAAKAKKGKGKGKGKPRAKLAHPTDQAAWVRVYRHLQFQGAELKEPRLPTFPHTRIDRAALRAWLENLEGITPDAVEQILAHVEVQNRPFVEVALGFTGRAMSAEQKQARKAQKQEEEQRIKAMSEEERVVYLEAKKQERKAEREAKLANKRKALLEQVMSEAVPGETPAQAMERLLAKLLK